LGVSGRTYVRYHGQMSLSPPNLSPPDLSPPDLSPQRSDALSDRLRAVAGLAQHVGTVTLAGQQVLPVAPTLQALLPEAGLRRGSTICIEAVGANAGALTLAASLVTATVTAGSWCAVVDVPEFGVAAAHSYGLDLNRCVFVPSVETDAATWASVVAAFLDACDVVITRVPRRAHSSLARRLMARARERKSVLVAVDAWPEVADVHLSIDHVTWCGLGEGWGHLQGRQLRVAIGGRGAAARSRHVVVQQDGPCLQVAQPQKPEAPEKTALHVVAG